MHDRHLESRLEEYVAGDLTGAELAEMEARLASDPKARALHDKIRRAHDALVSLRDRPEPPMRADEALVNIQRAIATNVFAGKPRLELRSAGTRFYRRVAVAAVLLCGVSLGLVIHNQFVAPNGRTTEARPGAQPSDEDRTFNLRAGETDAFEWLNESGGNLITFTPTNSVIPVFDDSNR